VSSVSDSSRLTGTATVTEVVPLTAPEVAVMIAAPSAAAVTRPAEETVATLSSDVVHETVGAEIVDPAAV